MGVAHGNGISVIPKACSYIWPLSAVTLVIVQMYGAASKYIWTKIARKNYFLLETGTQHTHHVPNISTYEESHIAIS